MLVNWCFFLHIFSIMIFFKNGFIGIRRICLKAIIGQDWLLPNLPKLCSQLPTPKWISTPNLYWGYLPWPKMVVKFFGNRNFMHPMGRFSMHSKCLGFFSFKFFVGGRGGGGGFFPFLLCSQHVPFKWPMSSH